MGAGTGDSTSTIQDQTSNNNDLTVSGASLVGYNDGTATNATTSIVIPEGSTEGRDSQGFLLSDTTSITNGMRLYGSEYVDIQDSEVFSFGDGTDDKPFSIESWVKMDDATYFMIASKGKAFDGDAEYSFFVGGSDNLSMEIFDESVDAYEKAVCNSTLTAYEGQWVHLVVTYDGRGGSSANAGITFYVNGSSQAVTLSDANTYVAMENHGADVRVGRWHTDYADGLIDEVRIYSKELSSSEVTKNYNNGKSAHQ